MSISFARYLASSSTYVNLIYFISQCYKHSAAEINSLCSMDIRYLTKFQSYDQMNQGIRDCIIYI